MKKNLKIVSATAAALLAVAPVAASTISTVNAAAITNITLPTNSDKNTKGDITLTSNLKAVTYPETTTTDHDSGKVTYSDWSGSLSGNVTATYGGQTYTVNLSDNSVNGIWYVKNNQMEPVKPSKNGHYDLRPGHTYYVDIKGASINLTTANANLTGKHLGSNGDVFFYTGSDAEAEPTLPVATNINGGVYVSNAQGANLGDTFNMLVKVVPTDSTNTRSVSFFDKASGNEVTSGSLDLNVGPNQTLNVNQILGAFNQKYAAHQLQKGEYNSYASLTTDANDIKDQLTKEGITVEPNGDFTPTANFSLNFTAKSPANGATATLPVSVNVKGAAASDSNTEPSVSTQIMYKSVVYNSKGEKTDKTIAGYDSANLVTENGSLKEYTINGGKYYKIANEDGYVRARNVTGSKMTLKKNAYAYKSNGKRANKTTYKKGKTITVYGGEYKAIKGYNGKAVRIGVNKYIKSANVNYKLAD